MPRFSRRIPPIVGAPVAVSNGRGDEIGGVEIVERGDVDGDVFAGVPLGDGNPAVRNDAAVFAKQESAENAALRELKAIDDERFCKTLVH